jgi:uroporphyrinogen-III synthase
LFDLLVRRGAEPLPLPTIRIEPIGDLAQLDGAIEDICRGAFDWSVFTSANAVEVFANRMEALNVHPNQIASMRVAAVGRVTAAAVTEAGLNLALVPEIATAEVLAATLSEVMRAGARVLYPRSASGRDVLPNELKAAGFDVLAVDVYRTLPEPTIDQRVLDRVRRGEVDVITFASPSSVRHLVTLLESECIALNTIPVVCAGLVTAQAAREAGLSVAAVSQSPDTAAISKAIAEFWLKAGVQTPLEEATEKVHAGRGAR